MEQIQFEHRMAAHCESGTVTALLKHAGMEISESMVFGLSGALFFAYLESKRFTFPMFVLRNRPGTIMKSLAKRTGIRFRSYTFRNHRKGEATLDHLLEQGIPVAAQVDFFYMDYVPEYLRVHINVHFINVVGMNSSKYLVSDSYHPVVAELDKTKMRMGRFARGFMAPKGHLLHPVYVPDSFDIKKAIIKAIRKNCFFMLNIPIPFLGVKGIYRFADKVLKWPAIAVDAENLSHQVIKIHLFLEEQGTGGGGFRFMYATFLKEAAAILGDEELNRMSEEMMEIGDRWRDISLFAIRIGRNRDFGHEKIQELSEMIRAQGDREKDFFTRLKTTVKG